MSNPLDKESPFAKLLPELKPGNGVDGWYEGLMVFCDLCEGTVPDLDMHPGRFSGEVHLRTHTLDEKPEFVLRSPSQTRR